MNTLFSQVDKQRGRLQRLGVLCDWDHLHLTPDYEAAHENEPRLAVPSCHGRAAES